MNHQSVQRHADLQNCAFLPSKGGRTRSFLTALPGVIFLAFLCLAPPNAHSGVIGSPLGWGQYFGPPDGYDQDSTNIVPTEVTNLTAITGGLDFSLGLTTNHTIISWGDETFTGTNMPASATNIVAISAQYEFAMALRADGTVVAWGDNSENQTDVPASVTNAVAIGAGFYHSLAVLSDHTVVAWGYNAFGQTNVPASATNVVAVAGGVYHSVALRADGTVVAWGYDTDGETNVPPSATNVVAIAAGVYHSVALRADGTVIAWGMDGQGQTNVPPGVTNAVAIGAGYYDGFAVLSNGSVVAWGRDDVGQTNVTVVVTNVVAVTGGYGNGLVLVGNRVAPPTISCPLASRMNCADTNGTSADVTVGVTDPKGYSVQVTWYVNGVAYQTNGVFGGGSGAASTNITLAADFLEPGPYSIFVTASNGQTSTVSCITEVYVDTAGDITARGSAVGGVTNIPPALTNAVALAAGLSHVLGLSADGAVFTWGDNSFGQTNMPVTMTNAIAIAAGDEYSLALKPDGTVVGWGSDLFFQTNVPSYVSNVVAIAAGTDHALALRSDGKIIGWGGNQYGETNAPASATNVVSIAAGGYFSLALRADGRVVGWGFNGDGEINVPASVTNAVAISAGDVHALALLSDGTVIGWGSNSLGEITVPAGVTNAIAISAGSQYSLALMSDGTIIGWGASSVGQINTLGITDAAAIAAGGFTSFDINTLRITLIGPSSTNIECHSAYTDPGATATGSCGADETSAIQEMGTVNTSTPGFGFITYQVVEGALSRAVQRQVTVIDTTPPMPDLSSLPDIVAQCGTNITTVPTSTDACAGPISGTTTDTTTFATQGTFYIHWTYRDGSGNSTSQVQRVVISETSPPVIVCPPNILVNATSAAGATVNFVTPSAINPCADVIVVCVPPSGSIFALGTNTVTCTASDTHGHQSQCSFSIIVLGALGQTVTAFDSLTTLRAGVTNTTRFATADIKDLNAALVELTNSANGAFWTDNNHPLTNDTLLVLHDDQGSVGKLLPELRNKNTTLDKTTVQSIVNQLVAAARLTAVVAINDATTNHVADRLIAAANIAIAKGDAATNPSAALRSYTTAWKIVHPKKG